MIALNEVDSGTIEASKAMGANNWQIITKVLIPEAKPALISSITVMAVSLVGYTAMAGAIGAGGLGNLAYLYGMVRNNNYIMYTATILILIIVFIIQFIGDYFVRKIDKSKFKTLLTNKFGYKPSSWVKYIVIPKINPIITAKIKDTNVINNVSFNALTIVSKSIFSKILLIYITLFTRRIVKGYF